jgi:predicted dehydrogenase
MMRNRKVKLGLIGAGGMARGHLKSLAHIPGVEVTAICDVHKKNLSEAAGLAVKSKVSPHNVMKFEQSEDLLAIDEIQAVIIASPNNTHCPITVASLKAGKHVLCEKPMATTVKDCKKMIKAARRSKKILQIGLEYRHAPLYRKVNALIGRGDIGNVRMMWCKEFRDPFVKKIKDWILKEEHSGGSLVEKDCHHFDLFNWMIGAKPVRVSAFGGNEVIYRRRNVIDHAWVITEYENGARTCLGLCFFSPYGNDSLEVGAIGTKGKLESYQSLMKVFTWGRSKSNKSKKTYRVSIPPRIKKISHDGAVYYEQLSFLEAVRKEKKPCPDGEIGKWSVAVPLAAEKAIKEKRVVEIKEVF